MNQALDIIEEPTLDDIDPPSGCIYHHTSLAHLPWILHDGHLRGSPASKSWPTDFVWGTTDSRGDRTTAICRAAREQVRVRILIPLGIMTPEWRALALANGWTSEHILRLARVCGRVGQHDTTGWRAMIGPLDIAECLGAEYKRWNGKWTRFDDNHPFELIGPLPEQEDKLAFRIPGPGGLWVSQRGMTPDGRTMVACKQIGGIDGPA